MNEMGRFARGALRSTALELAKSGDARAWNTWRQEQDLFGDRRHSRVDLSIAHLDGRDLTGFNLVNVSFFRAFLERADLRETDCEGSDFHEARLIDADLSGTNLRGARLSRAYLRGAKLNGAILRQADLRRASLKNAELYRADIRGVDLSTTRGLDQEQVEAAIGDQYTRLPTHLSRPIDWQTYAQPDEAIDDQPLTENPRPATVEVKVETSVLRLSSKPGDAAFTTTFDVDAIRRDILDDLDYLRTRCDNHAVLGRAIDRYCIELQKDEYDIIIIGLRSIAIEHQLNALGNSADGEPALEADLHAGIRAVLVQHSLLVNQSHKWRSFIEEASNATISASQFDTVAEAGFAVADVLENNRNAVDSRVPSALRLATEEMNIPDDARKLAAYNALMSVSNVYGSVIRWLIREARKFGKDAWEICRSDLSQVVGHGVATLIAALAGHTVLNALITHFPMYFNWLAHVKALLGIP